MKRKSVVAAALLLMAQWATGQDFRDAEIVEKAAERLETDGISSELAEELTDLTVRPVNLNAATEEEINTIPYLNPAQQKSLFDYLGAYGEVFSIYELQVVHGFDSTLVKQIEPFITIRPKSNVPAPTPRNLWHFGHHDLLVRMEQQLPGSAGFLASDSAIAARPGYYYPGDAGKYYFRYNFNWFDKIRIGLAGEKDPGEQFFRGVQAGGMDFYAGFLSLQNTGIISNLVIGNFRAGFGQGLTFGSGLSLNSVPGFSANPSNSGGIRPGTGMSEGFYLRGIAVTIKLKPFTSSGFVSWHPRDATILQMDTVTGHTDEFSSFTQTGYHRVASELSKRNAVKELIAGGNINLTLAPSQRFGFRVGATAVYLKYSAKLSSGKECYKKFSFNGDQNLNTGFDFQVRYRGSYFYGEISRSLNGGVAWLCGMSLTPGPAITAGLIIRDYHADYQNLNSNAFGQNSLNANEQGIFLGINAALNARIILKGYLDLYKTPWLHYRADSPVTGAESGIMITWTPNHAVIFTTSFSRKNNQVNAPVFSGKAVHTLTENITRNYRLRLDLIPREPIRLTTRLDIKEHCSATNVSQYGYCLCQDIDFSTPAWFSNVKLRFAIFDIPDYESRIYVYEPEVLYGYSVPAYQGHGLRNCAVFTLKLSGNIKLNLRCGITWYSDRDQIGTGLDMTTGNTRYDLTGQLMVRL